MLFNISILHDLHRAKRDTVSTQPLGNRLCVVQLLLNASTETSLRFASSSVLGKPNEVCTRHFELPRFERTQKTLYAKKSSTRYNLLGGGGGGTYPEINVPFRNSMYLCTLNTNS